MPRIEGGTMRRFERVREAFAENFDKRGDVGRVAVFIDGRPVSTCGRSCRQAHPPMGSDTT